MHHARLSLSLKRLLLALPLALSVSLAAHAQQAQEQPQAPQKQEQPRQAMPPSHAEAGRMMQKLARFRHVPLTVEKAKAAIEIFLTLKEKYPPQTFRSKTPGPMGAAEAMKRSEKAKAILELIRSKGFASIDEWTRTFASVGMALAHVREGDDNAEKKLRQLEQARMPEQMKAQIRAMLKAVIPPEQNVEVAKKLLADEQAKKMIEQVEKPR